MKQHGNLKFISFLICLTFPLSIIVAQRQLDSEQAKIMIEKKQKEFDAMRVEVKKYSEATGTPIWQELEDSSVIYLHHIENGKPYFYQTMNLGAAKTTRADQMWPGGSTGANVTGSGYNKIGIWDGGKVRGTHQELVGRVTQVDGEITISDHASAVAGTLIAAGVDANAKGMAYQSNLDAYSLTNDETEMVTAAVAGMEVSNHSYGQISGWQRGDFGEGIGWYWLGDVVVNDAEDYFFGFYSSGTADWDEIAYNAPNYLIVKAAGNDRDDTHSGDHWHWDSSILPSGDWVLSNDVHGDDGGASGYDCMITVSTAKNIMTVGAVEELINYTVPGDVTMSVFSSWGPADDGRIKPDLVAKGVGIRTSRGTGDTNYTGPAAKGTSYSTPNVAGTLALLQQQYQNLYASVMRSATLKALAIHSANDAGTTVGPDYQFGWGLLNAEYAAQITTDDATDNTIDELTLNNGATFTRAFVSDGSTPIKVTIVWTDPKGTPVLSNFLDNTTPMLVNDLDLKVIEDATLTSNYPWKLDPSNPANAATNTGENDVDNVEQVFINAPPAGNYTVEVTHDGALQGGSQDFSLILTSDYQVLPVELSSFTAEDRTDGVHLNWTTESETENLGFVIERRQNNHNWRELASYATNDVLLGQGSTPTATDYEYLDKLVENNVEYEYRLGDVDYSGKVTYHAIRLVKVTNLLNTVIPDDFKLMAAYPNPFNPQTTIRFDIPLTELVKIYVYNQIGQLIRILQDGIMIAGQHSVVWNGLDDTGKEVGAGLYLYRIEAGSFNFTRKMVLLK